MDDTARVFDSLMTGLGYETYAAQGGDWGSIAARCLGSTYSNHCKGASQRVHFAGVMLRRGP